MEGYHYEAHYLLRSLSFSILFSGCYSEASLTKDEAAPDGTKVFFYLKDGSYIKSYANHHQRVDGGYKVAGDLSRWGVFG